MRTTLFGSPLRVPPTSVESTIIFEPTLGLDAAHAPMNLGVGGSPAADNFIMREASLEPRPMLSLITTNQPVLSTPILGGFEVVDVTATRYPLVSTTTTLAFFTSANSWSRVSYVPAYGLNDPPAGSSVSYWDITQIYDPIANENLAIAANGSYQSLYAWKAGSAVFSSLTGAPAALYVESFDKYLLAFNLKDPSGARLVQRVQWSDRGSSSSWTGGLSGFEDLLDMRGEGKRVISHENRLLLFSEYEVWQGGEGAFPFVFQFSPLDRNIGTPYSWTICKTPMGVIFLGRDLNIWWLAKGGGPARQIGGAIWRVLRTNIDVPERAWATYDSSANQYQLYYAIRGGSGTPQRALYLDLTAALDALGQSNHAPSWAPQSFDPVSKGLSLTRGFEANLPASGGTTWSQLSAANIPWNQLSQTWGSLAGNATPWQRATYVGSSAGSLYYLSSTATSDAGTAVLSYWQSAGLGSFRPDRQKTLTAVRIDYQANSASSVSIQVSEDLGESFGDAIGVSLPATSGASQVRADVYLPARYPAFKVSSQGFRYRLWRFWATMRVQGR